MVKNQKYLYCPQCKEYPDIIRKEYDGDWVEIRRWDEFVYSMEETTIEEVPYKQVCYSCDTEVEEVQE